MSPVRCAPTRAATTREGGSVSEGDRPMHEPGSDYEQGRTDERQGRPEPGRGDEPPPSRPA